MNQLNWTEDRVEQLKSLWTEGLSASQIARALGGGVTRNAVIGKVHRLGLAGRATPSRSDRPRLPSAPRMSMRTHHPPPPIVEEDPDRSDHQQRDVPLAHRRPIGQRIPLLRPQAESGIALLRGPCAQGLPAAAATARQGADGELICASRGANAKESVSTLHGEVLAFRFPH
jgi:hypothetical protein